MSSATYAPAFASSFCLSCVAPAKRIVSLFVSSPLRKRGPSYTEIVEEFYDFNLLLAAMPYSSFIYTDL